MIAVLLVVLVLALGFYLPYRHPRRSDIFVSSVACHLRRFLRTSGSVRVWHKRSFRIPVHVLDQVVLVHVSFDTVSHILCAL